MKAKSAWHVWKNTVSCGHCNSSWHASDPDLIEARKTDECPQCKRNRELTELAVSTTNELVAHQNDSPEVLAIVMARYVDAYLKNRSAELVYRK